MISEEKARQEIGDHLIPMRQFFARALDRYLTEYEPSARADHDGSIRAQCIHGHVLSEAAKYAEKFPDNEVRYDAPGKCGMLIFNGHIAVRFKKLDPQLRPSNNETTQSRSFTGGAISDAIPASVTLDCGYQLNQIGDEIVGVFLVQRITADKPLWVMEINDLEVKTTVVPLFETTEQQADDQPPAVVKPRSSEVVQLRPVKSDE